MKYYARWQHPAARVVIKKNHRFAYSPGKFSYSRKEKKFFSRPLRIGLGMVAVFSVAFGVKEVVWTGFQKIGSFPIRKILVSGAFFTTAEEIQKQSGVLLGGDLLRLDVQAARARLLAHPWVEQAFVERRFPGTVVLSIRERKPKALLDAGALYATDAFGRVLPPSLKLAEQDLPIVSGISGVEQAAGTLDRAQALSPALKFLAFVEKKDKALASEVSEINLDTPGVLKVMFLDGVEAWFPPEIGERELQRLASVLSDLAERGERAKVLDFRFHNQVVAKGID